MADKVFTLYIRANNAAFADPGAEIARILRAIANNIELEGPPWHFMTIYDGNGNDVGRYALKDDT